MDHRVPTDIRRASLALSSVPSVGPLLYQRLLISFGSASAVLKTDGSRLSQVVGVGRQMARAIAGFHDWKQVDRELARLGELGLDLLCLGAPGYPDLLARIGAPPPVLYVRGGLEPGDGAAVSVVGTRRPDAYGRQVARDLAGALGARGVTVVSGLARGIDQEVHQACLGRGGRTVAVLGCGLDVDYPRGSAALREAIAGRGALISEFPPGTQPLPQHFPRRNRIISGLAWGVVLVQGTRRSGGMSTVGYALEQNREVFAVPGPIYSERSEGPHALLKQGATPVESADDVLAALGPRLAETPSAIGTESFDPPQSKTQPGASTQPGTFQGELSPQERKLMDALRSSASLHRDELAHEAGLDPTEAALILLRLELTGLIRAAPGGCYTRA